MISSAMLRDRRAPVVKSRARAAARRSAGQRGITLLEIMVSLGILALIATLIYGALDGMSRAREGLSRIGDRYHQGRTAMSRMTRELQSAFLSLHLPVNPALTSRSTIFLGKGSSKDARVDFTTFSHRRLARHGHESDQCEISYFLARDPDVSGKYDLVRREDPTIDLDPDKGGTVLVVAEDVAEFGLSYFDPLTQLWTDSWDSSSSTGQLARLPSQVKITLVLNHGPGDRPVRFQTKAPIEMQLPLSFAIPR